MLGFGGGALIASISFELFEEGLRHGGLVPVAICLPSAPSSTSRRTPSPRRRGTVNPVTTCAATTASTRRLPRSRPCRDVAASRAAPPSPSARSSTASPNRPSSASVSPPAGSASRCSSRSSCPTSPRPSARRPTCAGSAEAASSSSPCGAGSPPSAASRVRRTTSSPTS
ncbi:hypothetical protein MOPEL_007_00455 [Mobilicoccus pelagius NBRC 104925]|uniref:Uncharacterized protein n=1 Tax=Mobilicoccus pelagius NBRC 104925 TaxID=1089455 RepID=H5UNC1_9MICO|nr:hypothetical protein MOPEL_007_00455 [Mobilicoccus pelagius NBRC 104925]